MDLTLLPPNPDWFKSSYSGPNCDNCVEAAETENGMAIRDTKNRTGPTLIFGGPAWDGFVAGVQKGDFDR